MNARDEHESGENRTRRAMLATTGGLLLPAGLRAAAADEAEAEAKATTRRMPRAPRPELRYWANDTVVNFRNATPQWLWLEKDSSYTSVTNTGKIGSCAPGHETGFAWGIPAFDLGTDCTLRISVDYSDYKYQYAVDCETNEIGTPDVTIYWLDHWSNSWKDISGERDMDPNTTFEITHYDQWFNWRYGTYRFHVHRWDDGKEPLDDYDEWYTRFFVTMYKV